MKILEIQKVDLASFCYLNKDRYPFLLESVNHNDNNRYSILFAFPSESIVLNNFSDFDFLNELESQYKSSNLNCFSSSLRKLKSEKLLRTMLFPGKANKIEYRLLSL